jgi:ABC-type transporter Mla maintaining outer membrane lipid asymmetry ATPase subunit MlaF/ABC-type transporter Mla maintaining outer membrane lipid asymmetry permease subunit MlaE
MKSNALTIADLTVTLPGGRALLRNASLDVERGALVLLVGPSGSGKSTLLKLITGFFDDDESPVHTTGHVEVHSDNSVQGNPVGIVFQNHALFDELSPVDNVRFALDHCTPRSTNRPEAFLQTLAVPQSAALQQLSGGERQRVAVARTLAMNPPLLLFDEPTTGLDPYRAGEVADLIAKTHSDSQRTVIVVTHDYAPFVKHNPRIVLLDSQACGLRDVSAPELDAYFRTPPERETANDGEAMTRPWTPWLEEPGKCVRHAVMSAITPLLGWSRVSWKLRYLLHYLRMVLIGSTALYVAIAGAMLGFVTVFFGISELPYEEITRPLLTAELLAATGSSSFRVLVPLMTTILVSAKCGAAVSADVGARRLTNQFEAMRSFSARPEAYLHGNIVIALVVGTPLLTFIAYAANGYASLVAFLLTSPDATIAVFMRNFFATSWPTGQLLPNGIGWLTLKTVSCGLAVAALGYAIGSRTKSSSTAVSLDVGRTIFWSSLCVLAIHAAFAFVEF